MDVWVLAGALAAAVALGVWLVEVWLALGEAGRLTRRRGMFEIAQAQMEMRDRLRAMEKREVVEVPGLPRHDGTLNRTLANVFESSNELQDKVLELAYEVARLRSALRMLGGLQDDAGVTHASVLHDHAAYARGVLAGADPADVEGAIREGERS